MALPIKKFVPPGARPVVNARDAGDLVNSVFIAAGWPSDRLKEHVSEPKWFSEKYPSVHECCYAIGVVKAASEYLWHWVIGLDVLLWAESSQQAARLEQEVAPLILAENPARVQLWHCYQPVRVDFLKISDVGFNV